MTLTIDIARRILEASKRRAHELRSPVSIAIVDAGGHLVLFERMMSPYGWATSNISVAKATTAVMFNQSTDAVAQWGSGIPGFASSMATMSEGKFIMAAGGWPIRLNGATIGGIGVSGGNAPGRDDEIARAGIGALEAMAAPVPAIPVGPQGQNRPTLQPTPSYPAMPLPQQYQPQPQPVQQYQPPQQQYQSQPIEQPAPSAPASSYLSAEQEAAAEEIPPESIPSEQYNNGNNNSENNDSGGRV